MSPAPPTRSLLTGLTGRFSQSNQREVLVSAEGDHSEKHPQGEHLRDQIHVIDIHHWWDLDKPGGQQPAPRGGGCVTSELDTREPWQQASTTSPNTNSDKHRLCSVRPSQRRAHVAARSASSPSLGPNPGIYLNKTDSTLILCFLFQWRQTRTQDMAANLEFLQGIQASRVNQRGERRDSRTPNWIEYCRGGEGRCHLNQILMENQEKKQEEQGEVTDEKRLERHSSSRSRKTRSCSTWPTVPSQTYHRPLRALERKTAGRRSIESEP